MAASGGSAAGSGGSAAGGLSGSGGGSGASKDGGSAVDAGTGDAGDAASAGGDGGQGGSCSGLPVTAVLSGGKADVIWAIDSSGTMRPELATVQGLLNSFASFVIGTGIDLRVVAVAEPVRNMLGVLTPGLCVAPPLGSGAPCIDAGDSHPPVYTHVPRIINSHDALFQLTQTYPQWQSALRADASKAVVVVTDDDAQASPSVAEFRAFFDNAFAGSSWRFSGIYCRSQSANCGNAGTRYEALRAATGGVWGDLGGATLDWSALMKQVADAVVAHAAPTGCEWRVPPPPGGQAFDRSRVNVQFAPSSGGKQTLVKVQAPSCATVTNGWYYDDETAPTTVVVCPQTCKTIVADPGATVELTFGCESRRPIP